jgi:predicted extracellular nuclease
VCLLILAQPVAAQVVISQVYGGGGNLNAPYTNDYVELFNRGGSAVSLIGWSLQYASATGSSWSKTNLSGTIQPGQYFLVQEAAGSSCSGLPCGVPLPTPDATGSIAMSQTNAKVALLNSQTALSGTCPSSLNIVDFVGYGPGNCSEGSAPAPGLSSTAAAIRADGGCTDTNNNAADFSAGAPNPRNTASPAHYCSGPTDPSGVGAANPVSLTAGNSTLLTVAVTPGSNPPSTGITVTGDLSPIGGLPNQTFYDDATHGDAVAGDNTFSFQATVVNGTTPGAKTLPISIADAQSRTGRASIGLFVEPPLSTIHDIQGPGSTSPFAGQLVATNGIVTGIKYNGFFIQTPDANADNDPSTSEGIFVFTSSAPPAAAAVGNSVKVVGMVQEYIPSGDPHSPSMTEIAGSPAVTLQSSGNPLPDPVTLTADNTKPGGGLDQLERFEGMRVHVDLLTVVAPTDGTISEPNATATSNGVFYGVLPGIARPFTEPGIEAPNPIPNPPCCIPSFDGNPERLRVDSDALIRATPVEVTSGAAVAGLTGPLDYAFRTYTIDPDPDTPPTVIGDLAAVAVPDVCPAELTVATANLQRFYDTTNDPLTSDVVLTPTAFANRLNKVSLAIRDVMKFPDIIGVEEAENLSTLQALADKVNADAALAGRHDLQYAAYLMEGNDVGGIDVGFLVKLPRVSVVDVNQVGKDATYTDPSTGQPAMLNDRPPLVLRATVQPSAGLAFPVTVIVNHLRSLSGVDDPTDGPRVRAKRAAQAEFLAKLVQAHQAAGEKVISLGDYNATQFSDGYVDVMGTVEGTPALSDEVVLPTTAGLVYPPLTNLLGLAPAGQRYSYLFDGNAQELDHILVTADLVPRVNGLFYARNNADFPESYRSDADRPERFSDHDIPVAYFQLPVIITNASLDQAILWPVDHKMVTVTVNYNLQNACDTNPVTVKLSVSSNEPVNGTGDGSTSPDWVVVDAHHVQLRAERAGTGSGRIYTITITATDSKGNVTSQDVTVTVPHSK